MYKKFCEQSPRPSCMFAWNENACAQLKSPCENVLRLFAFVEPILKTSKQLEKACVRKLDRLPRRLAGRGR